MLPQSRLILVRREFQDVLNCMLMLVVFRARLPWRLHPALRIIVRLPTFKVFISVNIISSGTFKYMEDTTVYEIVKKKGSGHAQSIHKEVSAMSTNNKFQLHPSNLMVWLLFSCEWLVTPKSIIAQHCNISIHGFFE